MMVYAANEVMVKSLKHPISKMGFTDMSVGVNWPDDTFTHRRIRDGDVTTEAPQKSTTKQEAQSVEGKRGTDWLFKRAR